MDGQREDDVHGVDIRRDHLFEQAHGVHVRGDPCPHFPVQDEGILDAVAFIGKRPFGHQRLIDRLKGHGRGFGVIDDIGPVVLVGAGGDHHHAHVVQFHLVRGVKLPVKHRLVGLELQLPVVNGAYSNIGILVGIGNAVLVFAEFIEDEFDAVAGHDIDHQPGVWRRDVLRFQP